MLQSGLQMNALKMPILFYSIPKMPTILLEKATQTGKLHKCYQKQRTFTANAPALWPEGKSPWELWQY